MTEVIVANASERLYLDRIYETDMAEALKAMAIAGHGIAFLPHSAVEDAVAAGDLLRLDRPARGAATARFTLTMEIRLYRDKLAVAGDDPRRALVRRLWDVVANELEASAAARFERD
jgi:DNA-binding transcriptional LysR family regulator